MNDLTIKVSAYRIGDNTNPRYVWGVGLPTDFMEGLPEDKRKIRLAYENEALVIKLSDSGIATRLPNTAAPTMWSGGIGLHHISGMNAPTGVLRAAKINGHWNAFLNQVECNEVPDFIIEAAKRATPAEPEQAHFPAHHFIEDVQRAVVHNAIEEGKDVSEFLEAEGFKVNNMTATALWLEEKIARGENEIFGELVELTPELADLLMSENDGNRRIREIKLHQYISDILADRWQVNGEPIQVSKDGKLNNGQHRCSAVLAADKSIHTFMVFGVDRDSRMTIDTGANRNAQDYLSIDGHKYASTMASVARQVLAYEANKGTSMVNGNRVSHSEVVNRAATDPAIALAAAFPSSSTKIKRLAPPSVVGFVHYVLNAIDSTDAEIYLDAIVNGVGLEEDSAPYVVREKLMNLRAAFRDQKIEVFLKGWNAFRKNKRIKNIRITWELPKLI